MFLGNGIICGLAGGTFCAFLVALLSAVPLLGWLEHAVMPTFWIVGPAIGLFVGLATAPD